MKRSQKPVQDGAPIVDELGWEDRFHRGPRRARNVPPKLHATIGRKPKERPVSKGRVHKGKARGQ
jgi:hypothetical protein